MSEPRTTSTGHDARSVSQRLRRKLRIVVKGARQRLAPRPVQQYVFVAGMQRSGTNMLMDILERSPETCVFHETDARAYRDYELREPTVIRGLAGTHPAPFFVLKALCELDLLATLMGQFAPAKTVWLLRDWRDSVNSALQSFTNFVPQWRRLASGPEPDWRGRGMSETTRTLLRELLFDDADEPDGAAIMWYYRNVLFFEQRFERDARVRIVRYEDVVGQPLSVMTEVADFLGIGTISPASVAGVHGGSVRRRAPPAVNPRVAELCDDLAARFDASIPRKH